MPARRMLKKVQLSRRSLRVLPMLAVMGGIFFLSHLSGSSLPLPLGHGLDKLLHALAYGVLAATVIYADPALTGRPAGGFSGVMVVLVCVVYGVGDEFHQSFIPARTASLCDLLADAVGAFCLVVVAQRRYRRQAISR